MVCRMCYREWRMEAGSQIEGFYRILEEKLMIAQPRLVAVEKVRSDHTLAVFKKQCQDLDQVVEAGSEEKKEIKDD